MTPFSIFITYALVGLTILYLSARVSDSITDALTKAKEDGLLLFVLVIWAVLWLPGFIYVAIGELSE